MIKGIGQFIGFALYCVLASLLTMGLLIGASTLVYSAHDENYEGDPVRGAELAEPCSTCHGGDGMGYSDGIPRIVGQTSAYIRTQLQQFRLSARQRAGRSAGHDGSEMAHLKSMARSFSGMDDFVIDLSDRDIKDLSAYYAAQSCRILDKTPLEAPKIANRCAFCHGKDGRKVTDRQPSLASQHAIYLRRQLKLFRVTKSFKDVDLMTEGAARFARIMFTQARRLTDDQIKELSVYYESMSCE